MGQPAERMSHDEKAESYLERLECCGVPTGGFRAIETQQPFIKCW